ncbi:MAG: SET domain-containing protein-lysine N-methyltransferase [Spirochaetales bacterium]|nr:SET domain-containing protein-lysine N-methyltransferase [Spirochaetales bacterium]
MEKRIPSGSEEMKELFRSLSLIYLSRSRQSMDLSDKRHYRQSSYYKENSPEFDKLSGQYGQDIKESRLAPSSVGFIDKSMGRGLFSEEDRSAGDFIGEYCGVIGRALKCRPVKDHLGGFATDYAWTYPEKRGFRALEVNGRLEGNETRFVNHSFTPNCRMEHTLVDNRWVLFLVAQKEIARGEQFTVDYGEEYWTGGHRELIII